MSVKESVETAIDEHKVVIFSKSWCGYCKKAKALFKEQYPDETPLVWE
jgi:glutaredoxin 3